MMQRIVDKLVEMQVKNKKISPEERRIYEYGYTLAVEVFVNLVISVVIGIVWNSMAYILFFLCMYIPLRSFCGGWHANTFLKCTIISSLILIGEVVGLQYRIQEWNISLLVSAFFLCIVGVICLAPVGTDTKPIDSCERIIYKRKIYVILLIHLLIFAIMLLIRKRTYVLIITYVYVIQCVMLIFGELKKKRLKKETR